MDRDEVTRILEEKHSMTITISKEANYQMEKHISERKLSSEGRITKQHFIETAIIRELARVRGEDAENIPEAPDRHKLAQLRRRGKI